MPGVGLSGLMIATVRVREPGKVLVAFNLLKSSLRGAVPIAASIFRSPTYAVAKPLHLRPDLLAGEVALEFPDLLGIRIGAQPLQPQSVPRASLCRWRPGINLLLPGRIPGRRRDRRLTTDALAQALDLWSQAFACQLLLEPHNLVRVRLSPQLFQMLLVPDACLRWVHGFDRLRRPLR